MPCKTALPAVAITVEDKDGHLSGTAEFFFLTRPTEQDQWHVEGSARVPLLEPKVNGTVLSFEVQHYTKHGGDQLGPNVHMSLELTGATEARMGDLKLTRRQ